MCRSRAGGHSLAETLVVLLVLAILAAAASGTFVAQSRLARRAADRSETLAAVRSAAAILAWELRPLAPALDATWVAADSTRTRIFRGTAVACARDSTAAYIRYAGLRVPDPVKDSLLLLARGVERASAFQAVRPASLPQCQAQPAETVFALTPDSLLAVGDVALFFERGEYHLSGSALRYRHAAGGRQPLTADVLLDDSTELGLQHVLRAAGAAAVAVHARVATVERAASVPRVWRWRLPFLNPSAALDSLFMP